MTLEPLRIQLKQEDSNWLCSKINRYRKKRRNVTSKSGLVAFDKRTGRTEDDEVEARKLLRLCQHRHRLGSQDMPERFRVFVRCMRGDERLSSNGCMLLYLEGPHQSAALYRTSCVTESLPKSEIIRTKASEERIEECTETVGSIQEITRPIASSPASGGRSSTAPNSLLASTSLPVLPTSPAVALSSMTPSPTSSVTSSPTSSAVFSAVSSPASFPRSFSPSFSSLSSPFQSLGSLAPSGTVSVVHTAQPGSALSLLPDRTLHLSAHGSEPEGKAVNIGFVKARPCAEKGPKTGRGEQGCLEVEGSHTFARPNAQCHRSDYQ
eukprot:g61947.t1